MKLKLVCIILFALLAISSASATAAQKRPLSEDDLVRLLDGGVYSGRIAILVRQRGIVFLPSAASLESLRLAGADDRLLQAVATARRLTSQLSDVPLRAPEVSQQRPT